MTSGTKDFWEIGIYTAGKWDFEGRYDDPSIAIAQLVFNTGIALHTEREENGTYRVMADNGRTVACVRLMTHAITAVGDRPDPLRRWRGLTWVGWLNFLVLRWFLFRLHYVVEEDNTISGYGVRFIPSWRW